ncbi:MAG TPA: radical SAM protein [Bryobacteraceae bacterium]|jgi:radical SAM superfamily enzyme YgiQ (UPF0313 family)|nr:radical SAM protein [Bryobacteraceae bacterium]
MKILLHNPDNGVTGNFMPHLWMFLLQAITPAGHEVILLDGNAQPMTEDELVQYVKDQGIGLVGIGAMTRMIAQAYRVADAIRAAGIPVVMGGPHVTELPDEALGRNGGVRHADAVALGEADETWPKIVADAARGKLKEIYEPVDAFGQEQKPKLEDYPQIPWDSLDLGQFNRIPKFLAPLFRRFGVQWEDFHLIPIESGRGCPYGCEFCTVTGFFGDSIRFRTNESVVQELLRLKARARASRGKVAVFFVDDNFAINVKRTKSLLRDIIAAGAQLSWVGQISANLLRDEELVDLIAESGGKWVFIGMESLDPVNLKDVNKGFNKPSEYAAVLERLARRNVYAITSFIFGLDNDTVGVAGRTLEQIRDWPPGLPVFGQITPFPSTPLYNRLAKEGRLTRPTHWLDFAPFKMAHTPLKMSVGEVHTEVDRAWTDSYAPEATKRAMAKIADAPVPYKISHLIARLCFRGIYFPQKGTLAWLKVLIENRRAICQIIVESFTKWRGSSPAYVEMDFDRGVKRA